MNDNPKRTLIAVGIIVASTILFVEGIRQNVKAIREIEEETRKLEAWNQKMRAYNANLEESIDGLDRAIEDANFWLLLDDNDML